MKLAARSLSVVLPVYSETDSVRAIVDWLIDQLADRLLEIVIIASPKSSGESRAVCEALTRQHDCVRMEIQQQNPGLGNAVRQGLLASRGAWVLMMDSDGEMENETVLRMIDAVEQQGHALVVASRWVRGGGFSGYSPTKRLLNWGFQQLFRVLFRTRLHDLTYGFKLLRGDLARGIVWEGTLHEFACESTLKPVHLGVSVGEVPSFWTARKQGVTKNSFLRNFRYVGMAWRILRHGVTQRAADDANQRRAA